MIFNFTWFIFVAVVVSCFVVPGERDNSMVLAQRDVLPDEMKLTHGSVLNEEDGAYLCY